MGKKGKTPEKGQGGRTFTHDKVSDGDERRGWLSGDVHVLVMHVGKGRSKPCERALVGCACDKTCPQFGRPTEEIGFVPLRRDDGRPVCVLVRKAKIDFVAHMRAGSTVVWGRMPDRFEGVYVRAALKELPWANYFSGKPDDDLGYWLPMFLGTPHLADAMRAWFASEECQPVVTEPLPAPIAEVPVEPVMVPAATEPVDERGLGVALDKTLDKLRAKQRRMRAEQNGTGH